MGLPQVMNETYTDPAWQDPALGYSSGGDHPLDRRNALQPPIGYQQPVYQTPQQTAAIVESAQKQEPTYNNYAYRPPSLAAYERSISPQNLGYGEWWDRGPATSFRPPPTQNTGKGAGGIDLTGAFQAVNQAVNQGSPQNMFNQQNVQPGQGQQYTGQMGTAQNPYQGTPAVGALSGGQMGNMSNGFGVGSQTGAQPYQQPPPYQQPQQQQQAGKGAGQPQQPYQQQQQPQQQAGKGASQPQQQQQAGKGAGQPQQQMGPQGQRMGKGAGRPQQQQQAGKGAGQPQPQQYQQPQAQPQAQEQLANSNPAVSPINPIRTQTGTNTQQMGNGQPDRWQSAERRKAIASGDVRPMFSPAYTTRGGM